MTFAATHTVGGGGAATWPEPDPSSADGPRLDPWLAVMVIAYKGDWAHVRCENGWEAWTDGRSLTPITAPQAASGYVAPGTTAGAPPSGYAQPGAQAGPASGYVQPGVPAGPASGYGQPGVASGYQPAAVPPAGPAAPGYGPPVRRAGAGTGKGPLAKLTPAMRQRVQLSAAIGGGVAALSSFLPWLSGGGESWNAWNENLPFWGLVTDKFDASGPVVGLVVLVGALGLLALGDLAPGWLLAIAGACPVVAGALMIYRIESNDNLVGVSTGFGAYLAVLGGAAVLYAAYVLLFPPRTAAR